MRPSYAELCPNSVDSIRTLLLRIDELTKKVTGLMQALTFTGVRGFLKPCKDIYACNNACRPNVKKSQSSTHLFISITKEVLFS